MTQAADDRDHQRASDRPGITKGNRMHNLDRATCGDLPPTQAHAMVHWQDYLQGYAAAHYAGPARGSAPPCVTGTIRVTVIEWSRSACLATVAAMTRNNDWDQR